MCVWLIPFLRDNTETVVLPISVVSTLALSYPFPGKAFLRSQIEIVRYPFWGLDLEELVPAACA